MGTFSSLHKLLVFFIRRQPVELDYLLDRWIREAFLEDITAQPSTGAWERLCKAITERQPIRSYGMWILDEPFRDPPPSPPTAMSRRQYKRALRLYDDSRKHQQHQVKELVWSNLVTTFSALVNL